MDCEILIKVPRKLHPVFRRKQGFRFDMYCWVSYIEYNQIINGDKDEQDDELFMRNIMFFAADSYNRKRGIKRKLSNKLIQYWIDNTYQKDLLPVIETMRKSRLGGHTLQEYIDKYQKTEKKK